MDNQPSGGSRLSDKEGGGGGGLKDIFRSFRPQFGLKIRGEGRRRDPRAPDLDPPLQPFFFSSCFCEEKRMQRFVLPNFDTISLKKSTSLKSKITKKKLFSSEKWRL